VGAAGYRIRSSSPAWLHGPRTDLLLGAGLAYIASLPLLLLIGWMGGVDHWPLELIICFGFLLNTPHYGATLLRVYERSEERHKYRFFTVWVSLGLLAVFLVGVRVEWVAAAMMTLYFSWSPWHFSGQNYGLSLMFLRRGGIEIEPAAKRSLYLFYLVSAALPIIVFHSQSGAAFAPDFSSSGREYDILRVGIPMQATLVLAPLLLAVELGALGRAAWLLRRAGAGGRELGVTGLFALTQSLWFTVPALFSASGRLLEGMAFAAVWTSTAHSVQYLWVTSYYARREGRDPNRLLYYGKTLIAGSLIAVLPGIAAVKLVGTSLSWSGGLAILVFSVVNLHHFILDGAIWKLRDGRVAQLLLRGEGERPDAVGPRAVPVLRPLAYALGIACLAVPLLDIVATRAVRSGDLAHLESVARPLGWLGRERMSVLSALADGYLARGETERAEATYRHALSLKRDPTVLNNLAWLLSMDATGDPERAREAVSLAEEAVSSLGEADYEALDTLAVAYAAAGRYADARRVGARALELARADQADLASPLASRLALYQSDRPYRTD
jgi:tetratricopeptide (TPR) repeat protein